MKFRFIKLGKGQMDLRSFGLQWLPHLKVFYGRFYLIGLMVSFSGYDPAKDLEDRRAKLQSARAVEESLRAMNRHDRRATLSIMKKITNAHSR